MSVEQLAIDTKIPRASIEALEDDRFSALPGPVFVKGFFRCCARSLELDPETVLSLLHEQERALQQLKSGRRERQAPHLLGRGASSSRPEAAKTEPARSTRAAQASPAPAPNQPVPAAASGNAAVATAVPVSLFNFDAVLPWLRRTLATVTSGLPRAMRLNTRLLMWIAIGLMIAVIVMSAFVMVGGPTPTPRS